MSDKNPNLADILARALPWRPEAVADPADIPTGDMPGDKVKIDSQHVQKSQVIFPRLFELLGPVLKSSPCQRAVVVVCGGSGVGKSEIASLISLYLNHLGVRSYTLSGDNYPHRIPKYNDAERLRVFRQNGLRGLIARGLYCDRCRDVLKELQLSGSDCDPALVKTYPWLSAYQSAGRGGLKNYLGTPNEIDFRELSGIVAQFKNGADRVFLKRMGREETELWYEPVDFSHTHVLVIEWTHGNNHNLLGVDIPILLNSTPQETLEHRRSRARDGATDSLFTTLVLGVEQDLLVSQACNAKIIVSKNGEILSYDDYVGLMCRAQA